MLPSIVRHNAAPESSIHIQLPLHACTASWDLSEQYLYMTCNLAWSNLSKRPMLANAMHILTQVEGMGVHPHCCMLTYSGSLHRA